MKHRHNNVPPASPKQQHPQPSCCCCSVSPTNKTRPEQNEPLLRVDDCGQTIPLRAGHTIAGRPLRMYFILTLWTTTLLLRRCENPSRLCVEDKSHRRVLLALGVLPDENTQGPPGEPAPESSDWMKELEGMKNRIQNIENDLKDLEVKTKNLESKTKDLEVKTKNQENDLKNQEVKLKNLGIQIAAFTERVDNFSSTMFGGMTNVALLETAIYEFVQAPSYFDDTKAERFKYGVACSCSLVLFAFVENDGGCLYENSALQENWNGPETDHVPKDQGTRRAAMIQGLYGTVAYVDAAPREDVENWDPSGHYPVGNADYGTTKAKVEAMRASFESVALSYEPKKSFTAEQALEHAVDELLAALDKKSIRPQTAVKEEVLKFLHQDDFN